MLVALAPILTDAPLNFFRRPGRQRGTSGQHFGRSVSGGGRISVVVGRDSYCAERSKLLWDARELVSPKSILTNLLNPHPYVFWLWSVDLWSPAHSSRAPGP